MRVIVPIKQVPLADQLKFDHSTKRIVREGVPSEINPFDKRALTRAIQLVKEFSGQVVVLTMGPPQAQEALVEALAMGADRAVHLLGREFAGADTLATARAIAAACKILGFDLILCGKYSADSETAQVPPMLAEMLDIPQITAVTELVVSADAGSVTARREIDQGFETLSAPLPVLLTAAERLTKPIRIAPADLEAGRQKPVQVMGAADLGLAPTDVGLEGSPTWVSEIYSIEPTRKHIIRNAGDDVQVVADQVVRDLVQEGLFGDWKTPTAEIVRAVKRKTEKNPRTLLAVAELAGNRLRSVSLEILGRAVHLANEIDGRAAAVVIGHNVQAFAEELVVYGADTVYVADAPEFAHYSTDAYTSVLVRAIQDIDPFAVFLPSTTNGRDLAPRVAARLGIGLTGDAIGLEVDGQGRLAQLKPAFGGNVIAPILSKTRPVMATIRPGMLTPAQADRSRRASIQQLPFDRIAPTRTKLIRSELSEAEGIRLDDAHVVVGVGTGLGGADNLDIIRRLADVLDAPIAGTRKVVDVGWLPRQVQVGLTGRSISPRLYVAVGISGKFNHVVGIQRAHVILAINNQADADIFRYADYGIVGDWKETVQALTAALERHKTLTMK